MKKKTLTRKRERLQLIILISEKGDSFHYFDTFEDESVTTTVHKSY